MARTALWWYWLYAEDRELMMDILRYGPDVEVMGPPELRRSVSAALDNTLSLYTRGS